jgi:hypothetical protein
MTAAAGESGSWAQGPVCGRPLRLDVCRVPFARQSRGGSGLSVGCRSSVSSSSASFASRHIGQPSPRAIRSRTSVLGLPLPASIARSARTAMSAASATLPRMEGYSISRSSSAGVVPRARASRRSVRVVASACAFSSSLMNDRSTPLRWASLTCESPLASREARRLRAS